MHSRIIGGVAALLTSVFWSSSAQAQAQQAYAVLQGQSNAYFLKSDWNWDGLFGPLVKDLTGIPTVTVLGEYDSPNGHTIASDTATYDAVDANRRLWLRATGTNPFLWSLDDHGQSMATFLQYHIAGKVGSSPVALFRFHSEYDSKKNEDDQYYGDANRRFVGLMRSAAGLSPAQMPVFYGSPAYTYTHPEGIESVRSSWLGEINDSPNNAHNAFGNIYDIDDRDNDLSHLDSAGGQAVAARMALAYARYLYDKGYAVNDLSSLPKLGARISKFSRVSGVANKIDLQIEHDKGTSLVITGKRLDGFELWDSGANAGRSVTGSQLINGTTLRLTLSANLSNSSGIYLDYLKYTNFYGPDSLIMDNWHARSKPAHIQNAINARYPSLKMPLRRLMKSLQIGIYDAPSLDDPSGTTPPPPVAIASGTYLLTPQCATTRAMDGYGGSSVNGTRVAIWSKGGGDANRRWVVTDLGGGSYSIRAGYNNNMSLDVPAWSTTSGTVLQLWEHHGGDNQKWNITSNGDGTYRINPVHATSLYLSVVGNANADNTDLSVNTYTGATGQKWTFTAP